MVKTDFSFLLRTLPLSYFPKAPTFCCGFFPPSRMSSTGSLSSRVIWQVSCLPKRARLTPYIQSYLTMVLGLTKCPLFLATLDPGPGKVDFLLGRGQRPRSYISYLTSLLDDGKPTRNGDPTGIRTRDYRRERPTS